MAAARQAFRMSDKISLERRADVNRSSMKEKHPVDDSVIVVVTLPTELMFVSFLLDISSTALVYVILRYLS
jgi:hypothetical protein